MKHRTFFCALCGHARRWGTHRCYYCHGRQSDVAGIDRLARRQGTITLRCPYTARGNWRRRCTGRLKFSLSAFGQSVGVAGNGPGGYLLAGRLALQGRCPECGHWMDSLPLLSGNAAMIRRQARRGSQIAVK